MMYPVSAATGSPVQFGASGPQIKRVFDLLNCQMVRQNGSHCIMKTSAGRTLPPIPMHGNQSVSVGVVGKLAEALGVPKNTLEAWAESPKRLKQVLKTGQFPDGLNTPPPARLDQRA